jgi:CHAD domain-containing protein/CYTH domain-containing protein
VARLLPQALGAPAEEGARIIALHWYYGVCEARERMRSSAAVTSADAVAAGGEALVSDDAADLHRARVALRRLRATLKEHRDLVDIGKRLPRELRALNAATNAARDGDVQRAWLLAESEALGPDASEQGARLLALLAERADRDRRRVAKAFAKHWDPIADALVGRLSVYWENRIVGQELLRQSFAAHLAARVSQGAGEIEVALSALVASPSANSTDGSADFSDVLQGETQEHLHELRISLKRQRAMLAPFAKANPAIGRWYESATRGQDSLGAMRDASLLAALADGHGMTQLADALRTTALGHYEAFHRAWSGDNSAVSRIVACARGAVAGLDASAAAHAVPREIERKYLLRAVPPHALAFPPTKIEQGWLPGELLRERLRRAERPDGTMRFTRTVKIGPLGSRIELEEVATGPLFEALWPHTVNARIRKLRHPVPDGDFVWEIDVFQDRDLVLAEVELTDGQDVPPAPDWLAPYIVRDVTDDASYTNSSMASPDVVTGAHAPAGTSATMPA